MLLSMLLTVTAQSSNAVELPEIEDGVSLPAIMASNLERLRREIRNGHSEKVCLNAP
jgi:hypothetical protein